jgi:O-antigen ligase
MFILFILVDILIFLAGERASFLFFNLFALFFICFVSKFKLTSIAVLVCAFLTITFITINNKEIYDRYVTSIAQNLNIDKSESPKLNFFSIAHESFAKTSLNMFLDKPILGHGPNSYRVKCSKPNYAEGVTPCNTHPHNFYIQLLAETGVLGTSFLIGLLFYFIYLMTKYIYLYFIHKKRFLSDYQICLLGGLLITIWPITTNGNIFNNHLMLLYSLQMGFFRQKI